MKTLAYCCSLYTSRIFTQMKELCERVVWLIIKIITEGKKRADYLESVSLKLWGLTKARVRNLAPCFHRLNIGHCYNASVSQGRGKISSKFILEFASDEYYLFSFYILTHQLQARETFLRNWATQLAEKFLALHKSSPLVPSLS